MKILFWNINGSEKVSTLLDSIESDVVFLLECPSTDFSSQCKNWENLTERTESRQLGFTVLRNQNASSIAIARQLLFPPEQSEQEAARCWFFLIEPNKQSKFLVVLIHNWSKKEMNETEQYANLRFFSRLIHDYEVNKNNFRTIVIGDFNADPFDPGMMNGDGMNAIPYREIIKNRETRNLRIRRDTDIPMFFNPMWKFFGLATSTTHSSAACGTFYYNNRSADVSNYWWHIFDQVLVRPSLVNAIDDIEILTKIGDVCLLKDHRIKKRKDKVIQIPNEEISDHLPVQISVNLL